MDCKIPKQAEHSKFNNYIEYFKEKGFLKAVYNYLYFLGCWIIRRFKKAKRKSILFLKIHRVSCLKFMYRILGRFKNFLYTYYVKAKAPMRRILFKSKNLKKLSLNKDNLSKSELLCKKRVIIKSIVEDVNIYVFGALNYILPVAALIFVIGIFNYFNNMGILLKVEYNGAVIGYIQSESDFYKAEKLMKARLTNENYIKPIDAVPRFTIVTDTNHEVTSQDELIDSIISFSGNQIIDANGLYVDGRFIGALEDADPLLDFLSDTLESNKTGEKSEKISFVKKVEVKNGLYPVSSLRDKEYMFEKLSSMEETKKTYIVEAGDVPGGIAQKFGMPYKTLKQLNPNIENELFIGQEVLISAAVPYLGIQRTVTETYENEIPFKIEKTVDEKYDVGYSKVVREGENGIKKITAQTTYVDGIQTEKNIISSEIVKEPVNEKIVLGGKVPVKNNIQPGNNNSNNTSSSTSTSSSGFIWPTVGGITTCRFWGYVGHSGQDIGVKIGTPIYAMASGTVVISRYAATSYGNQIMIDHGGGYRTRYAHNSQLLVQVGDWVEQGQLIAYSGNSGRSFGPHVHVEIILNGQCQDPAKYIGYYPH